jgi:ABC-type Fe3+-siderophore transport system permease subunit
VDLLVLAVALGAVVVPAARGSWRRLIDTPIRWPVLLPVAVAAQVGASWWEPDRSATVQRGIAFALLLVSFALVMTWCVRNRHLRALLLVLVGVGANALVVAVNGGMPVRLPDDASAASIAALEESVEHHLERDDDHLMPLADVIVLPRPLNRSISAGDVLILVGVAGALVEASRWDRTPAGTTRAPGGEAQPARPTGATDDRTSSSSADRTAGS